MVFISAQPDDSYYAWQLEIQLRNLQQLGITKEKIHVLIGFDKKRGINPLFKKFIRENENLGSFFVYADLREKREYLSSIRPNILHQHFINFPELKDKTLFYHDSDVLFSRIPKISDLAINDVCYVSDTSSYLNINYIRQTSCESLLDDMLKIVGLEKDRLVREDENCGGAQYILKGITADFWKKVEYDSEKLYFKIENYNTALWLQEYASKHEYKSQGKGIKSWYADMWAVLWNLWLLNKRVQIHPEMNFSWSDSPIQDWDRFAILHYTGNIGKNDPYFRKTDYINFMPWYDENLKMISNVSCGYKVVQSIRQRKKELDRGRLNIQNKLIILSTDFIRKDDYIKFKINRLYIRKYFNVDVVLFSNDVCEQIQKEQKVIKKSNLLNMFSEGKYVSFIFMQLEQLLNVNQLLTILSCEKKNLVFHFDFGYKIDSLFIAAFSKILEMSLLDENRGKFTSVSELKPVLILDKLNIKRFIEGKHFDIEGKLEFKEAYLLS